MFPSSSFSHDINNHYTDTYYYYNSKSLSLTFITLIIFPSSSYSSSLLYLLLQAALLILIHCIWFLYLNLLNIVCFGSWSSMVVFSVLQPGVCAVRGSAQSSWVFPPLTSCLRTWVPFGYIFWNASVSAPVETDTCYSSASWAIFQTN